MPSMLPVWIVHGAPAVVLLEPAEPVGRPLRLREPRGRIERLGGHHRLRLEQLLDRGRRQQHAASPALPPCEQHRAPLRHVVDARPDTAGRRHAIHARVLDARAPCRRSSQCGRATLGCRDSVAAVAIVSDMPSGSKMRVRIISAHGWPPTASTTAPAAAYITFW